MKKNLLFLLMFTFAFPLELLAAEAFFAWSPNSETNLAGYKIYYGTTTGKYSMSVDQKKPPTINGVVSGSVPGLTVGSTYYFAATAYDTDGFESLPSNEVVWRTHERLTAPLKFYMLPEKKIIISVE